MQINDLIKKIDILQQEKSCMDQMMEIKAEERKEKVGKHEKRLQKKDDVTEQVEKQLDRLVPLNESVQSDIEA